MSELHREDIENISTAFLSAKILDKNTPIPRPEKEVLKEVISAYVPQEKETGVKKMGKAESLSEEEKKVVKDLTEKALVGGVRQAVALAERTGQAEIIEALHDELTDHFYEKLVTAGLIDPS